MKLKDGLMLREVAGQWIVVPLGANVVEVNGIITLSSSAALLWKAIQGGSIQSVKDLADVLVKEYGIDRDMALQDSEDFANQLKDKGLLQ